MSAPGKPAVFLTCALCARPCLDVDEGRGWIHLEVTCEKPVDDLHRWEVDLCSQAHAAEWLARPLPAPIQHAGRPGERAMVDRLAEAGCFAVLALVVVVLGVGAWSVAGFVVGLF